MGRTYESENYYCGVCKRDTKQLIYDSEHERDSSYDWQKCLECGSEYHGMTGKWEKPRSKPSEDPND